MQIEWKNMALVEELGSLIPDYPAFFVGMARDVTAKLALYG